MTKDNKDKDKDKDILNGKSDLNATDNKDKKKKKVKHEDLIEELSIQVVELKEQLLRNAAELENFKKRTQQERINERKYALQPLLYDILEPIEQLSKITSFEVDDEKLKNFLIGFKMISNQFNEMLKNNGVEEINALNQPFDPSLHHAIEKVNDETKENGINVEEIKKGYKYKDRILRPSLVKVNEWSENENGENK